MPATVKNIFESWSNNPGYPVVQVTRNYDTSKVTIGQKRFFSDGTINADQKYFVPITMTDGSSPNFDHIPSFDFWLSPTTNDMTIDFTKKDDWLLLNKQQHGYYRVNYDVQNWKLLTNELHGTNFTKIHHLNRAALIDDSFNLAKANFIDTDIAMDILHYLKQEEDFIPWMSGYNALVFLMRMFRGSAKYGYLEGFIRNITRQSFKETGWILKDDHVTELHRTNIIYLACFAGTTDCVGSAKDIVNKMVRFIFKLLPSSSTQIFVLA
jgi:aminopeptidase N